MCIEFHKLAMQKSPVCRLMALTEISRESSMSLFSEQIIALNRVSNMANHCITRVKTDCNCFHESQRACCEAGVGARLEMSQSSRKMLVVFPINLRDFHIARQNASSLIWLKPEKLALVYLCIIGQR